MGKRLIVFAPHPDDETFGCGGTIVRKLRQGYDVKIVFLTDGRNAFTKICNIHLNPSPREVINIRKMEAKKATSVLGVKEDNLEFLGVEDVMLNRKDVVVRKNVAKILKKFNPHEVYFPQPREINSDHREANALIKSLVNELGIRPLQYQYAITWQPPFSSSFFKLKKNFPFWFFSNISKLRYISVDISEFLPIKRRAINQYRSQIKCVSKTQKKAIMSSTALRHFMEKTENFFISL
jgi:LmbE family N-acetylglucosaminyl deacetylase